MKRKILRSAALLMLLGLVVTPLVSSAYVSPGTYCVDRKTPDRPNTGYCTIDASYGNGYVCLPGGYTCDGQM